MHHVFVNLKYGCIQLATQRHSEQNIKDKKRVECDVSELHSKKKTFKQTYRTEGFQE